MRGRERRGRVSSKKKKKAVITGRHKIRMEKGAWNGRRERGTRRVTRRVTRHSERRARGTMAPIGIDYLNYLLTPPPAVNRESGWTDTCSSRGGGGGGSGNTGPRDARASLFHGERERERDRDPLFHDPYIFDIYLCHCLNYHRHGGVNWIRSWRKRHRSIVPAEWERVLLPLRSIEFRWMDVLFVHPRPDIPFIGIVRNFSPSVQIKGRSSFEIFHWNRILPSALRSVRIN